MKFTLVLIKLAFTTITVFAQLPDVSAPAECRKDDDRIQVMLIGSYHMSNPGADVFNLKADDVLSEKRQSEVRAIVESLKKFRPTKVAIEAPFGHKKTIGDYRLYKDGKYTLGKGEDEQIGFRLAQSLKHENIYPIDANGEFDFGSVQEFIKKNPEFAPYGAKVNKLGQTAIGLIGKTLSEGTIAETLYLMNTEETLKASHLLYIDYLAPIGKGKDYAGANLVGSWYTRNIRIFSNLTRISEENDRIVIIYGQGHVPIIRQLLEDSIEYCRVSPLPYLK